MADLQPSIDANPWGPLGGPLDVLGGALLYEHRDGGRRALMAVRPVDLQHGRRLDVVGLVSTGDRLAGQALHGSLLAVAQRHGADMLAMSTQRAHVVRQCARHGWDITGVVMNLRLPHVRQ